LKRREFIFCAFFIGFILKIKKAAYEKGSPDFLGHNYLSQVEKEMTNMDLMMKT
jgi:hypothetical protein